MNNIQYTFTKNDRSLIWSCPPPLMITLKFFVWALYMCLCFGWINKITFTDNLADHKSRFLKCQFPRLYNNPRKEPIGSRSLLKKKIWLSSCSYGRKLQLLCLKLSSKMYQAVYRSIPPEVPFSSICCTILMTKLICQIFL